jgi:hypothetical protein
VATYDNPTQKMAPGVMAHMVGLFVPDDMNKWPKLDTADPTLRKDLASLQVPGYGDTGAGTGHEHMQNQQR